MLSGKLLSPITVSVAVLMLAAGASAQEEFTGPFASWANAKTGYGATGNGSSDDTAALQRALNELGTKSDVLYLPAGTYRITGTLYLSDKLNVSILGQDPSNTVIRWDGPSGGAMMIANGVSLSRWGRITWDGAGRAGIGVAHQWDKNGGYAPTNLSHEDEVFKDVGKGLEGGIPDGWNDAEVTVSRAKFLRCWQAGISVEAFNVLDWWIWDSEFTDNARGVTNEFGAGNFLIYRSVFRNSAIADVTIRNTQFFTFRGNTSVGSRQFLLAQNVGQNGARITIQENRILDTTNPVSVEVSNLGPVMLLDNQIRSLSSSGPAVKIWTWATGGDLISVGNKYTVSNAIAVETPAARWWTQDDQVVARSQIDGTVPVLPGVAPNLGRRVFEVAPGSGAAAIQSAINQAAVLAGQRPVVHLPKGDYPVAATIAVPANADVQIVGDGHGSSVRWTGPSGGAVFRLDGPSKATLRELAINAGNTANGIVVENADQPGARIHADGLYQERAQQRSVLADKLVNANVNLHNHQADHAAGVGLEVVGSAGAGTSRLAVFGGNIWGNTGDCPLFNVANGGRLYVQDVWFEGGTGRVVNLRDSGTFTYHGGHIAPRPSAPLMPVIELNNFRGRATFLGLGLDLSDPARRIQVTSENASTDALFLGLEGYRDGYFSRLSSGGRVALLNSRLLSGSGSVQIADAGTARTADFIRTALEQTRSVRAMPLGALAAGVTDVRLFRVAITNPVVGLHIKSGGTAAANQRPTVSAGPDQSIVLGGTATLDGSAADDGLPSGVLTTSWSQVSGPGAATLSDPARLSTGATFPVAGSYVLRLTATDGALSSSDDVTVTVTSAPVPPPPSAAAIRVNAGGPAYTDPQGKSWSADTGYAGGNGYTTASAIANTAAPALYQSERWNAGPFTYQFALPNGAYNVTLKFAEIFFTAAGKRVFNVSLNGAAVLSNFDVCAAAGGSFRAIDKTFVTNVTNGQLAIQFSPVVENPKVSAIEITPAAVSVTPSTAALRASQTQQFTASTAVSWSLSPAVGTISASGLYTAPSSISTGQTVTVKAASTADPNNFATATITLLAGTAFTPIRVNAGGPAYTDPAGQAWSADQGFSGGSGFATTSPIAGTTSAPLYQSERYNTGALGYSFAVPNGTYTVTLKFAEIFFTSPGSRVFNVAINGQPVLANFDIVAAAGGAFKAVDRSYTVAVTNGKVDVQLAPVVQNPKISAIEIR